MTDPSRHFQDDWTPDVVVYHVLALALELGLLIAVAAWSYLQVGGVTGWVAAGASIVLAGLVWGVFAAPKSGYRLRGVRLLVFKLVAFGAGALALWGCGWGVAALVYTVLALVSLGFAWWRGVL